MLPVKQQQQQQQLQLLQQQQQQQQQQQHMVEDRDVLCGVAVSKQAASIPEYVGNMEK
jgi:hypothetical protein